VFIDPKYWVTSCVNGMLNAAFFDTIIQMGTRSGKRYTSEILHFIFRLVFVAVLMLFDSMTTADKSCEPK